MSYRGNLTAIDFKQFTPNYVAHLPVLDKWQNPHEYRHPVRCSSMQQNQRGLDLTHPWSSRQHKGRIFILFPFNAELDWIEIQLQSLHQIVDHFVIVELPRTFTGHTRSLIMMPLMQTRFRAFRDQIIFVTDNEPITDMLFDFEQYQLQKMWTCLSSTCARSCLDDLK